MFDPPTKLYKYRKFDVRTLSMVTDHGLYFSDPRKFNDPLDCNMSIKPDISLKKLADLLKVLMGKDREAAWNYAIDSAVHMSGEHGNWKTDTKVRRYLARLILADIQSELQKEFDAKGVISFSDNWRSVLMWSHYADEHRGICIEFDTTEVVHQNLAPIKYDGERSVKASDLYAWKVEGDAAAGKRVFDMHFYGKAPGWSYEGEWRDISDKQQSCEMYRMTAIYLGYRCPYSVTVALVKMLGLDSDIRLHDVYLDDEGYELASRAVDIHEVDATGMRGPIGIEMTGWFSDEENGAEQNDVTDIQTDN